MQQNRIEAYHNFTVGHKQFQYYIAIICEYGPWRTITGVKNTSRLPSWRIVIIIWWWLRHSCLEHGSNSLECYFKSSDPIKMFCYYEHELWIVLSKQKLYCQVDLTIAGISISNSFISRKAQVNVNHFTKDPSLEWAPPITGFNDSVPVDRQHCEVSNASACSL